MIRIKWTAVLSTRSHIPAPWKLPDLVKDELGAVNFRGSISRLFRRGTSRITLIQMWRFQTSKGEDVIKLRRSSLFAVRPTVRIIRQQKHREVSQAQVSDRQLQVFSQWVRGHSAVVRRRTVLSPEGWASSCKMTRSVWAPNSYWTRKNRALARYWRSAKFPATLFRQCKQCGIQLHRGEREANSRWKLRAWNRRCWKKKDPQK